MRRQLPLSFVPPRPLGPLNTMARATTGTALTVLATLAAAANAISQLSFRADGTFKIVQFADMHYSRGALAGCSDILPEQVRPLLPPHPPQSRSPALTGGLPSDERARRAAPSARART